MKQRSRARVRGELRARPRPASSSDPGVSEALGREMVDLVARVAADYLLSGGLGLAQALFEGLAVIEPRDGFVQLGLGLTYDRLDRPEDAIRCYTAAIRLRPRDPRPRINLAELMLETGDLVRARRLLREALTMAEEQADQRLAVRAQVLLARTAFQSSKRKVA